MFDEQAVFDETQKSNAFEVTTGGTSGVDIDNVVAHIAHKLGTADIDQYEDDEL